MHRPRIERLALGKLAGAAVDMHATVVIPPATALEPDQGIREQLTALDLSMAGSMTGSMAGAMPRDA
jgi:hypothetical protein